MCGYGFYIKSYKNLNRERNRRETVMQQRMTVSGYTWILMEPWSIHLKY